MICIEIADYIFRSPISLTGRARIDSRGDIQRETRRIVLLPNLK